MVDKRLETLRLKNRTVESIRSRIKRYGSNFDATRYESEGRQHLVADTHRRAVISLLAELETNEPNKADSLAYAAWREKIENLRRQIPKPDPRAPLLAMTTTAAAYAFEDLEAAPFDYVVFDEASQISLPYACALGTLGKKKIFAGDPKQLAPIVVAKHPTSQNLLRHSPFHHMREDNCCQLDEQNRMAPEICDLVAHIFYDGQLYVEEASERNPEWNAQRSVPKVSSLGRERLHIETCASIGGFATQGGSAGVFRPESAKRAVEIAKECSLSHSGKIAIITPFRKQRRDIERLVRTEGMKNVTVATVHSVQGGEFHTVIFDPVLGESIKPGGKLLSDEQEAPRLINVALSRAQARFVILLSASDRSNALLQQLADAIDMQRSAGQEHEAILEIINHQFFPEAFVGRYVRHRECTGRLLSSERKGEFAILTRSGKRKFFRTDIVRASLLH